MPSEAPTSPDLVPDAAPGSPARAVAGALAVVALFWFLCLFDRVVYAAALEPDARGMLLVRACKWLGTLWPWIIAAALLIALDARRLHRETSGDPVPPSFATVARRGLLLLFSAASAGAIAEVLKILFRRERPNAHDGFHAFRSFTNRPLHSGGLDLPSSHAATAFGAAFALCALFPRLTPLWLLLATACACTRVLDGAHFISSVFLAAAVAFASARAVLRIGKGPAAC